MNELPEIFDYFERTGYRIYPSDRQRNIRQVSGWRVPIKIARDKIFYYLEPFDGCKFSSFLANFLIPVKQPGKSIEMDFCDHCLDKF